MTAAALFYSDYRQAFEHDPFYSGFLTQCWSLAVEEQFYLIWAALLLVALKFGRRQIAYALTIAGILLSAADRTLNVLAAPHWSLSLGDRVYYSFDTRADTLFLGCLLGLIATGGNLEDWTPRTRRVVSAAAMASAAVLVWILFSVNVGSRSLPLVWIPVGELASWIIIVYFIVQPKGLGTKLIGISALVLVGDMTYTIYLVHFPVFVAVSPTTVGWPMWVIQMVRLAIVIPIVVASWYFVEKPLMQWRRKALRARPDRCASVSGLTGPEGTAAQARTTSPAVTSIDHALCLATWSVDPSITMRAFFRSTAGPAMAGQPHARGGVHGAIGWPLALLVAEIPSMVPVGM